MTGMKTLIATEGRDILRVEDLRVTFPLLRGEFEAVCGASLRVLPGKVTALVGESGSGKTVTSQTVLGLQTTGAKVTGQILFDEGHGEPPVDLLSLPHDGRAIRAIRGNRIGTIFQEPMTSFSPLHTIGDQISEVLRIHKPMSKTDIHARCVKMLGRVGFEDPERVFDMYPFELSGGMRQRAMIAMALICDPALLIADEPTTALDVTIQAQILLLLKELQEEFGMAILLITHDLGVVAEIADEVVVMYNGRVMEAGPVEAIFRNPGHVYLKGLLSAIPTFDTERDTRLKPLREIPVENADRLRDLVAPPHMRGGEKQQTPILTVKNLSKTFTQKSQSWFFKKADAGTPAVDDVSFEIYPGECLGLVGESGSGKTTVGKMILRAVEADAGSVTFDNGTGPIDVLGASGETLDGLRTQMQMIFQDPISSLSPRMTVGSILNEPLDIHERGTPEERRETVSALLKAIGLEESAASRYPHSFSGGQRQRIGIARALTLAPELIVCDEVSSALDVSVQAQVLNLLKDLQRELDLSYLFISHDLAVINYMADRIAVMWQGRLVEIGPSQAILRDPAHPYTRALLSAVPHPDPDHKMDISRAGTSATEASQLWPDAFVERPGERLQLIDIGEGHQVRMRADNQLEAKAG
ncbi:ABC transporter ATP-binding protein [Ovoidimarina sediminis]|uniref:ABC transporter ATP-binding protein n=1 Tax=Ovoidimarina sediminis TaxID=3079856 RepID=UPI002911C46B|nr:ABC transporter ATP-binding protein [Rhodophyticola sp. MJ-SS7]MDU8944715.1 ABC transporter ATP-binding protein [Rhodophyticola sp. MJ-SS7]